MGRAGRGGGGGSRGGGFGGSRGFGSHSGGSSSHRSGFSGSSFRSSGSSYRSSRSSSHYSSGYHHHYNSGPRFYYFGGTRYSNSNYSGGYSNTTRSSSGLSISKVVWIVIIIVIGMLALMPEKLGGSSSGVNITKSTVDRKKLESTSLVQTDYSYHDDLNWITSPTVLKSGMDHFYEMTGVQPFLYITDNVESSGYPTDAELEKFGNKLYDKYFKDEAHLLVVFYEKNEKYRSFYVTGTEAKTVIDDEAGEILLDYIDHYYYSNYDESEFFSRSFSEAADRIMRVTPNYFAIIAIFIIVAVIIILLFSWWKKKKKHKLDEMKQAQDILNSDLNEFGSADYTGSGSHSDVDDLKKKYDNL